MIPCASVASLLDLWLEGRLTPARTAEVAEHLKDCAACARLAARSRSLRAPRAKPPAGFAASLKARLARAPEPDAALPRPRLSLELAAALAAAACLLWAGSLGPGSLRPPTEAGVAAAEAP